MELKPIRTKAEYKAALREIETFFDAHHLPVFPHPISYSDSAYLLQLHIRFFHSL